MTLEQTKSGGTVSMCKLIIVTENTAVWALQGGPLPHPLPERTASTPAAFMQAFLPLEGIAWMQQRYMFSCSPWKAFEEPFGLSPDSGQLSSCGSTGLLTASIVLGLTAEEERTEEAWQNISHYSICAKYWCNIWCFGATSWVIIKTLRVGWYSCAARGVLSHLFVGWGCEGLHHAPDVFRVIRAQAAFRKREIEKEIPE